MRPLSGLATIAPMRAPLLLALCLFALPARASDDLTPEKAAKIEHETNKALDAVDKKYGNKKSSELSSDERREVIRDRAAAEREVLEKNDVKAADYIKYTGHMNKDDRAATKAAAAKIGEKEKADAEKKEKEKATAGGPKEIQVQRGFNDEHPVVLEEKAGAAPVVEKGLPQDYNDDQAAAGMTDSSSQPAPAKAAGKKGKGK